MVMPALLLPAFFLVQSGAAPKRKERAARPSAREREKPSRAAVSFPIRHRSRDFDSQDVRETLACDKHGLDFTTGFQGAASWRGTRRDDRSTCSKCRRNSASEALPS